MYKLFFLKHTNSLYYVKMFNETLNLILTNIDINDFNDYNLKDISITNINNILYNKILKFFNSIGIVMNINYSNIIITEIINVIYYPLINRLSAIFDTGYNDIIYKFINIHESCNDNELFKYCNNENIIREHHIYFFRKKYITKCLTKNINSFLTDVYTSDYIINRKDNNSDIKYTNIYINYLFTHLHKIKLDYYVSQHLLYTGSILEHIYIYLYERINMVVVDKISEHIDTLSVLHKKNIKKIVRNEYFLHKNIKI